jgi:tRNA nucleotidyltransferase (CCA-adding enzyme)
VEEWNSLDAIAAKFAKMLLSKENATPSTGFNLFTSYDPEAVLWLGFTSKDKAVLDRYHQFLKVWPEARQRFPHALMQEMRITPDLATYKPIMQTIFLKLIDGELATTEEMRAFLEPHSPPAPPPQVTVKRPRAKRGEAKAKERSYDEDEESEDAEVDDDEMDDMGGDSEEDDIDLGIKLPKVDLEADLEDDSESDKVDDDSDSDDSEAEPEPVKRSGKGSASTKKSKQGLSASSANPRSAEATHKVEPGNASATPPAPSVHKPAKTLESRKEEQMAKAVKAAAPGVKPLQAVSEELTPASAAPAIQAEGLTPKTTPPQVASAHTVTPGRDPSQSVIFRAPGIKPPQSRPVIALSANAMMPAAKKVAKKAPLTKAFVKKSPAKPAPKKSKPLAKKAAKPMTKSAPAKKAPPLKKSKPVVKAAKKR